MADCVGLDWTAPVFYGESEILDYKLWYDNASSVWEIFQAVITDTEFTALELTQGSTYLFKVEARNIYGYSFYSNVISVLVAQIPAQPEAPLTTWDQPNDDVVISWVAPDDGGSAITGYRVSIGQSDLSTYTIDFTNCDMTSSVLATCTIPVTALIVEPYSLPWGSSVYAKVIAINIYGDSA